MAWPTDDDHDTHEDYERRLELEEEQACNDHDTHEDYERRLELAEEQACNYQGVHHLVPVPMHEGLVQCLICHGWEGGLATECPGRKLTYNEIEAVYGGMIDFRNGQWVRLKEGPLLEDCLSSGG